MQDDMLLEALKWYGESPIAGPAANPTILEMLASTSYPKGTTDEVPWCSAFLNWIGEKVGMKVTGSAAAFSWASWGMVAANPVLGDVVVLGWVDKMGQHYHVGLYIRETPDDIWILAGNSNDTVNISLWKKKDVIAIRCLI